MEKLIRNRKAIDSLVQLKTQLPVNFTWKNIMKLKASYATYMKVVTPVITDLPEAGIVHEKPHDKIREHLKQARNHPSRKAARVHFILAGQQISCQIDEVTSLLEKNFHVHR